MNFPWQRLHLALGLTAGAVFALIGVTGSLLVFQGELDRWLNPALFTPSVSESGNTLSPGEAQSALEAAAPEGRLLTFLNLPGDNGEVYRGYYGHPDIRLFETFVTLDPYTGEVLGTRSVDDGLMRFVHILHFRLQLDRTGQNLVGSIGLLMLLLFTAGLVIWYRQRRAAQRRWHPTLAVYGLPLLFLIVISGTLLALPQYTRPAVERVSPLSGLDLGLASTPAAGSKDIGLDRALTKAAEVMPEATPSSVGLPRGETGIYRVSFQAPQWQRRGSAHVVVDRYNGEILAHRHWSQRSGGDQFMAWLRPLHVGSAFGLPGKILYALAGLLPLLLYVTGVRLWLRRRREV